MLRSHLRLYITCCIGLAFGFLAACKGPGQAPDVVYMGPAQVFALQPGAKVLAPEPASTAYYEQLFNHHPQYNQPLHRIVKSTANTVYLGVVMDPLPPSPADLLATDSVWTVVAARKVGAAQVGLLRGKGGQYNVRYLATSSKTKFLHVINLLTTDSADARQQYEANPPLHGRVLL